MVIWCNLKIAYTYGISSILAPKEKPEDRRSVASDIKVFAIIFLL